VALARGWDVVAIYCVPHAYLALWAINEDGSYEAVPLGPKRRPGRRPPPRRPAMVTAPSSNARPQRDLRERAVAWVGVGRCSGMTPARALVRLDLTD